MNEYQGNMYYFRNGKEPPAKPTMGPCVAQVAFCPADLSACGINASGCGLNRGFCGINI